MTAPRLLLDLTRRYCEPHRYYHTIEHVANMLHVGRGWNLSDEQVYAIWYHDAVYDPRSRRNEEDSAELAQRDLSAIGWKNESVERVVTTILDTKEHRPSIPESAAVIDLDLSSLAADWVTYERNRVHIRKEYAWVPEADYHAGSLAFLESMLERDRIFTTPMGEPFEAPARANLKRAITALR